MAASFSETAVATNWLMLIPSALARRSTSAFTERGKAERVGTLRAFHVLILLSNSAGDNTSIPNVAGEGRCRTSIAFQRLLPQLLDGLALLGEPMALPERAVSLPRAQVLPPFTGRDHMPVLTDRHLQIPPSSRRALTPRVTCSGASSRTCEPDEPYYPIRLAKDKEPWPSIENRKRRTDAPESLAVRPDAVILEIAAERFLNDDKLEGTAAEL